jgi:hypothetical protein
MIMLDDVHPSDAVRWGWSFVPAPSDLVDAALMCLATLALVRPAGRRSEAVMGRSPRSCSVDGLDLQRRPRTRPS